MTHQLNGEQMENLFEILRTFEEFSQTNTPQAIESQFTTATLEYDKLPTAPNNVELDESVRLYLETIGVETDLAEDEEYNLLQDLTAKNPKRVRAAKVKLRNHNLGLVVSIAKQICPEDISLMDLISDGNAALQHSLDNFNPAEEQNFSEFLKRNIRSALKQTVKGAGKAFKLGCLAVMMISSLGSAQNAGAQTMNSNPYGSSDSGLNLEISGVQQSQQAQSGLDETTDWQKPSYVSDSDWQDINEGVKAASKKTGIPANLIYSLIKKESSFKKDAVSRSGAVGLTQLKPSTAAGECHISESDLHDAKKNIMCGTQYLDKLLGTFKRLDLALTAYNAGPGAVKRAVEAAGTDEIGAVRAKLSQEAQQYAPKILGNIDYQNNFL